MPNPLPPSVDCSNVLQSKMAKSLRNHSRCIVTGARWRATPVLGPSSWMVAFQLIELGLLISERKYGAFLDASIAFVTGVEFRSETRSHE